VLSKFWRKKVRKVAIFTGTRAEYGLLYWIIKAIHESDVAELQLIVGGMHLSPEFGYTINQIKGDGFPVSAEIEFLLSSDSPVGVAKSMGLAVISAAEAIDRLKPDLLVLLGDRFEAMAIAQSAMLACIPIAHIHGGETTQGLIDEAIRHSLTKMSHIHFTSTEPYKKRVIQMGEDPSKVFNVGAPGIDNILGLGLMSKDVLSESLGFDLGEEFFLVTYHPVTLEENGAIQALENLLSALDDYAEYRLVITFPNADTHGRQLVDVLERYGEKNSSRVYLARSLGQLRYLSVMKHCSAVVGNSSSGLIEAPSFKVPVVNIGNRQKGRIAGDNVICCEESRESIDLALKKAISDDFFEVCKQSVSPYGVGGASKKIVDILLNFSLKNLIFKSFFDLEGGA